MLFSSMEFLLFFFPIVFGLYFLLPLKARNYWLLLASLFFYAWGEPSFVFVMIFSIVVNYLLALRIEELSDSSYIFRRVWTYLQCWADDVRYKGLQTGIRERTALCDTCQSEIITI